MRISKTARRQISAELKWCVVIAYVYISFISPQYLPAQASPPGPSISSSIGEFLDMKTIQLWDDSAPGSLGKNISDMPTLTVFLPQPNAGNGTSVIVAPGGAYVGLASNLEGRQVADWLSTHGVTAFVLRYRLGPKYVYPIPLEDVQRAIRFVRFHASEYGISTNRIGVMGFSAGGHLAAVAGTLFDPGNLTASDPVDRTSSRPDFLVLAYPWLNAMQPNQGGFITYCSVIRSIPPEDCKKFELAYTPTFHVSPQTPPSFIYATSDDETVPVNASIAFYQALRAAGVPVEMHIFAHGAHGSGLGDSNPALDLWPGLLEAWLRGQGLLTQVK